MNWVLCLWSLKSWKEPDDAWRILEARTLRFGEGVNVHVDSKCTQIYKNKLGLTQGFGRDNASCFSIYTSLDLLGIIGGRLSTCAPAGLCDALVH